MIPLAEVRVRTRIPASELAAKEGRNVTPGDWNIQLTGPSKVLLPDGRPLCIYLPQAMAKHTRDEATYAALDAMGRSGKTGNRGKAGATLSLPRGTQKRSYAVPIHSNIIGAIDPGGIYKTCRTTVWTGAHMEQWQATFPALQDVARYLEEYVPDRYAAQMDEARKTKQEWVVPGTPFTTITVNHSYPTGTHTDKGDLDKGFSSIFCARRGSYTGGQLCFPEYRIAVDLQDGDLILMDAHQWHSNAALTCECGNDLRAPCKTCGAGRVSVVSYFRTRMVNCDTPEAELAKAKARREVKLEAQ